MAIFKQNDQQILKIETILNRLNVFGINKYGIAETGAYDKMCMCTCPYQKSNNIQTIVSPMKSIIFMDMKKMIDISIAITKIVFHFNN